MNHTPAPWAIADGHCARVYLINDKQGRAIGELVYSDARNPADARLIAAAPELAAALRRLHLAVTMRPTGAGGLSTAERAALDGARSILATLEG